MGEKTAIEWTDHTFNPWWGCTHVHEGCRNCYAETWAKRFGVTWGPSGIRRVASEATWKDPLKWNRAAEAAGVRAKVFCASMADVFEDWQGPMIDSDGAELLCGPEDHRMTMDDARRRLFDLIDQTPWLDWQLVTKRPENIARMVPPYSHNACITGDCPHDLQSQCDLSNVQYRDNVWLLTSVSDQATATKQITQLRKCRDLAPVMGLSIEPLLGPIDLRLTRHPGMSSMAEIESWERTRIDWIIVGGESGHGARPMHPDG